MGHSAHPMVTRIRVMSSVQDVSKSHFSGIYLYVTGEVSIKFINQ